MRVTQLTWTTAFATAAALVVFALAQPEPLVIEAAPLQEDARLEDLKNEAVVDVESRRDFTQQMVDMIYSFNELGFQEFETQRYVTGILEDNGFTVELGVAGIPSAWWASWGSGAPVIALGTDVDGIPQASQKPGVAYRDALIKGAPGHGEGHNAGQALMVTAALAVKKIMERDGLPGTLKIWPGIAEEQLGTKAHYVRAGLFDDVDVVLYSHVSNGMAVSWGESGGNGMVSVEYLFEGESAHGAGSPWDGRSALDAVELMNIGWNYRREHLRIQQRSHYVITDGGDQPNVVPPTAAVWYFFRETDYPSIMRMWEIGNEISEGAAMMTSTTVDSRVLGAAWPQHMNKPLAEAVHTNILEVGLPEWSDADQRRRCWAPKSGACRRRSMRSCVDARTSRTAIGGAAGRTTSATSPGWCRPCRSGSRRTSRAARGTTGTRRSRWRPRLPTRARPPAPRSTPGRCSISC